MVVYVLHTTWSNPDDEGNEIQVFSEEHLEEARDIMRKSADGIKACYHDEAYGDPWEDDYTWESEDDIHLGFCDQPFGLATIYTWEIERTEVK